MNLEHPDTVKNELFRNNTLFFSDDKEVIACSVKSGEVLWKQEISHCGDYTDELFDKDEDVDIDNEVVLVKDQVIVVVCRGKLVSLNAEDGTIN